MDITARVNEVMDVEVSLWQGQFGYPLGTVAWTAIVESRAQLADETAKLAGDQGYLDLLTQGLAFVGTVPFEDSVAHDGAHDDRARRPAAPRRMGRGHHRLTGGGPARGGTGLGRGDG